MTKFSIVTPSFNQGRFIDQTIESVLSQKGDFEIEYFIMDAGSTDETVDVLKKYDKAIAEGKYAKVNKGINFFWQSKKDNGQSDAINQGLKKATGSILAYINSDDFYEADVFSKISEAFSQNPEKKWLTGYCKIIDENNSDIQALITSYKKLYLGRYSYHKLLTLNFISQPATFWTADILKEFGTFRENLHLAMDYEYWLRIGVKYSPIILKEKVAGFRIHTKSKGKQVYIQQFAEDYSIAKQYTKSRFILFMHKLHNGMITLIYRIIK